MLANLSRLFTGRGRMIFRISVRLDLAESARTLFVDGERCRCYQ